jgi:hypothetical protein
MPARSSDPRRTPIAPSAASSYERRRLLALIDTAVPPT